MSLLRHIRQTLLVSASLSAAWDTMWHSRRIVRAARTELSSAAWLVMMCKCPKLPRPGAISEGFLLTTMQRWFDNPRRCGSLGS